MSSYSRLGVGLSILLLLRLDLSADDKLSDIIVLGQVEEFADLQMGCIGQQLFFSLACMSSEMYVLADHLHDWRIRLHFFCRNAANHARYSAQHYLGFCLVCSPSLLAWVPVA
jgi:hypothetical protein